MAYQISVRDLMKSQPTRPVLIQDEVLGDFILCCPLCYKPIYGQVGNGEPTKCEYCGQKFLWRE